MMYLPSAVTFLDVDAFVAGPNIIGLDVDSLGVELGVNFVEGDVDLRSIYFILLTDIL